MSGGREKTVLIRPGTARSVPPSATTCSQSAHITQADYAETGEFVSPPEDFINFVALGLIGLGGGLFWGNCGTHEKVSILGNASQTRCDGIPLTIPAGDGDR